MSAIDDNKNKQSIDEASQAAELGMETAGLQRHKANQARMEPSARKGQHNFKEEILQTVVDELDVILKDVVNGKGGPDPQWLLTFTKIDSESGERVWKYDMYIMADAAISEAVDGHFKEWSEQYMQEQIGKAIYGLLFEFIVRDRRAGNVLLSKLIDKDLLALDKQLIMASGSHETRREILFRKMEKWGFKKDWSQGDYIHHAMPFYEALKVTGKFEIKYKPVEGKKRTGGHQVWANYMLLTEEVLDRIEEDNNYIGDVRTAFAATWKVPVPWSMNSIGPYHVPRIASRVPLVRGASLEQQIYLDNARKTGDINGLMHALNVLQEVPYVINTYVSDAANWIHNNNKGFAKGVRGKKDQWHRAGKLKKFPVLEQPPVMHDLEPWEKEKLTPRELRAHWRKFFATRKIRNQVKRNIGEVQRYLKQVERLQSVDAPFYLPHNMDFRGRVYCVPDFNPQQVDYIRAMFYFANKKRVNDSQYGEAYLRLQIANTYGLTKEGYDARDAWVLKNENDIISAGSDFRSTFSFWSKAKEPLQFLAACREWKLYKQDPDNFESGLPIGQDATQSGIQIFAAAAMCAVDGEKVNLRCFDANGNTPTQPFDMYQVCLQEAKRLIATSKKDNQQKLAADPITPEEEAAWIQHDNYMLNPDIEKDDKAIEADRWKNEPCAEKFKWRKEIEAADAVTALQHEYDRNVIKRQVMTLGYSATQFGFAEQIREDWIDNYTDEVIRGVRPTHPFGEDYGFAASNFLAKIHMQAIKNTLSSVQDGMDFIVDVATTLSANNKQVKFVSRMGFPHFQNYRKTTSATQKLLGRDNVTNIYKTCAEREYRKPTKGINRKKVRSGSSPNLVHNTDGTLLFQTVLNCSDDRGVHNLMVIHDSFSTTAADARDLYQAVREEFIMLFEKYDLYDSFRKAAIEQLKQPGQTDADFDRMSEADFKVHCANNGIRYSQAAYNRHCLETLRAAPKKKNTLDIQEVWHSPYFFN